MLNRTFSRLLPGPVALCAVTVFLGCSFGPEAPDLNWIYSRSAQLLDVERNPVVVIPGLLGSKLENDDEVVWGLLGGRYANPATPEGARHIALPMAPGKALAELRDDVAAVGVLDRVQIRLLGVPIEVSAYQQILQALGVGGFRDETQGLAGVVNYGPGHYTCFQFPFDWRRDIAEAAKKLHLFLKEKRAYVAQERARRYGVKDVDVRFDLVAHSMGGLVVRYYLRYGDADLPEDGSLPPVTWAGARWVEKVVLVGTPNGGSLAALRDLTEGRKFAPTLPRYGPAILGTFPGSYQLLPRSRHKPVVLKSNPDQAAPDLLDVETWKRYGWGLADPEQEEVLAWLLPDVHNPQKRREIALNHLEKSLRRARQVTAALDQPAEPPPGLELHLLAGDAEPTPAVVAVDEKNGRLKVIEKRPGDAVVLRSSALMDERSVADRSQRLISPIRWSGVTFLLANHLDLTRHPAFTDNVLFLLLERPR